jgi:capsular polysaccharide biosynthesis protein
MNLGYVSNNLDIASNHIRRRYGLSFWKLSPKFRKVIAWGDEAFSAHGGDIWLEAERWQPNPKVFVIQQKYLNQPFQIQSVRYTVVSRTVLIGNDGCAKLPSNKVCGIAKRSAARFFHEEIDLYHKILENSRIKPAEGLCSDKYLTLSLVNRFDRNYGHWMCELLPQVTLLISKSLEWNKVARVIIRADTPRFVFESLQLFFPRVIVDVFNPGMSVGNLLVVQNPTTGFSFLPSAIKLIRQPIRDYIENTSPIPSSGRFYFSRPSLGWRKILNECDLYETLNHFNIAHINPSELSFEHQVRMFAAARFLCGIHGSAFINMLFAENCSSLEFVGSYGDVTMASLSSILDFKHSALACQSAGDDAIINVAEAHVAIEKCL